MKQCLRQNILSLLKNVGSKLQDESGFVVVAGIGVMTLAVILKSIRKGPDDDKENKQIREYSQNSNSPNKSEVCFADHQIKSKQSEIERCVEEDEILEEITASTKQRRFYNNNLNNLKNRTLKASQHRMNDFKEDHHSPIVLEKDRDMKTLSKRNPNKARLTFETDQEYNKKKGNLIDLAQYSDDPCDKLFFTLRYKMQLNEEDE